jgi:hypothetical protein
MAWANELEFSDWLHANIQALGTIIDLELEAERREARVGRLSADLLARVRGTTRAVIIENQVHAANHGHFGQVLTYASHYDATVIVWIATHFREEYRVAIRWLNTLSAKQFYAVELGASDEVGTPSLAVVAGPGTPPPSARTQVSSRSPPSADASAGAPGGWHVPAPFSVPESREASPGQLALNAIFEQIAITLAERRSPAFQRLRKPTNDRNYFVISSGPIPHSEWSIVFTNDDIRIELVLNDRGRAKADIERLAQHASALQPAVGYQLDFDIAAQRTKQKVIIHRATSVEERSQHAGEIAAWCAETVSRFAEAVARLGTFEVERSGRA